MREEAQGQQLKGLRHSGSTMESVVCLKVRRTALLDRMVAAGLVPGVTQNQSRVECEKMHLAYRGEKSCNQGSTGDFTFSR